MAGMSEGRRRERWLVQALDNVKRRASGVAAEGDILTEIKKLAVFDLDAAQNRYAKQILNRGRKHGNTKATGQFFLPLEEGGDGTGFKYEPQRLVKGPDPEDKSKAVWVEHDRAPEYILVAEDARANLNFSRVERLKKLSNYHLKRFQGWLKPKRDALVPEDQLNWRAFYTDAGLLQPLPAEPDEELDDGTDP